MSNLRRRRTVRAWAAVTVTALALSFLALVPAPSASAADPCGADGNAVACENSKPGSPATEWDVWGAGAQSIQGFATRMSVNVGERVDLKIDTDARDYDITIYRTGWYGGLGARRIASVEPSAALPQNQPECYSDAATELYDCGNWAVSASWTVPADAVSGVYIALLERPDTGEASHIIFVVRDDAGSSDVLFQTSDTTWQAYNTYGGSNFYWGGANGRAYKLSYNRPFSTRGASSGRDFYFSSEYAMVRFLERNGYDISYTSGLDTEVRGHLLTNHDVFLSVGHDEYWSGRQRANVEAARDAGVHLGFFTGNEVYWRTRWEDSTLGADVENRTLVSYKETWANGKIDPSPEWTGTWRDPRFAAPAVGGGLPENALTGTAYMSNDTDLPVTVSAEEGRYRLWRHTELASLAAGTAAELAPHTVGYESNEDLDNGFRPPGLVRLSTTTGAVPQYLQDFGNRVAPGTTTHHTTMYRAGSGALVFSTGSIQWAWGLDAEHDGDGAAADPRMQQATVNLLADMGVAPSTLMPTLVAAEPSTDTTGPAAAVESPAAGEQIANGTRVTATGTAGDAGGRVAGVEVSTDGGTTWHPAQGTTAWSYTYTQHGRGPTSLLVRAVDDSANIGPAAEVSVTVSCPCSILGADTPTVPAAADSSALELGLRFTATIDGYATGVRFYRGNGTEGTHAGSLWSVSGEQLATVTFPEGGVGWQEATFDAPVPLTAGTTYVVSYTAPLGNYAVTPDAFWSSGISAPPLAVEGGFGAVPAGVYGSPGRFPDQSYAMSHYWVDVLFSTVAELPLTMSAPSPLPGSTSVPWASTVTATLSKPATADSVAITLADAAGDTVAGATAYDAETGLVTFTPAEPLPAGVTFTATLTAVDAGGQAVSGEDEWSFTTAQPDRAPGEVPLTLFDDSTVPAVLEAADLEPVTLGVRFSAATDGTVEAVRFYKGPGNTGPHRVVVWDDAGNVLAETTTQNESTQGWQTAALPSPVPVTAGAEYRAGYRTVVGRYSYTPGRFTGAYERDGLTVPERGGVFSYADAPPTATSSTDYLVDVLVRPAPAPLRVVTADPWAGTPNVAPGSSVTVVLNQPVTDGASISLSSAAGAVAGTTTLSADRRTLVLDPADPLATTTTYDVQVDADPVDGPPAEPFTWQFTTADANGCPCTLLGDATPTTASVDDPNAVELGTAFTPTAPGTVTGVRFYKGPANTGTHTGSLWSSDGTLLATATFADESPAGWQYATFDEPVQVAEGATYVVSYLAPRGGYSASPGYFDEAVTAGELTAEAGSNGRYRYGGGFPTESWRATNYFADVLFLPGTPTDPRVTAAAPADGTTGVSLGSTLGVTLDKVPREGEPTLTLTGADGPVAGASSFDPAGRQVLFVPDGLMPAGTTLTLQTALGGTPLAGGTITFTTGPETPPEGTCPCTLWTEADKPEITASDDDSAVQVGVRLTAAEAGTVTAIRYYKGLANTGEHTVRLWTGDGALLGSAVATGESAAGWQTVALPSPVTVTPGTEYIATYHSTAGRYALTAGMLADGVTRGPLSTLPTGGAYTYGTGAPTGRSSSSYWVDAVFAPAP